MSLKWGAGLAFVSRQLSVKCVNTAQHKKLVVAVLGLAVTALVVDKVFLGGGATASLAADAGVLPTSAGTDAAPAGLVTTGEPTQLQSVTAQLVEMDGQMRLGQETGPQLVDAFSPPRAMAEVLEAEAARQALQERQSKSLEQAALLREQLRLTATRTTGQSAAMINGTLYPLGSDIPGTGFRLTEIDRKGIVLEDTTTRATVRLEMKTE